MNSPRNVIAIDRIPVSSLTGFQRTGTNSVKMDAGVPWQSLTIKVPARLTITDKIENGVRLYTAHLFFKVCQEDMGDWNRQAYRCHTADGRQVLIGSDERPYPVATVNDPRPDNMTDSQLCEVTVNYTSASQIPYIQ